MLATGNAVHDPPILIENLDLEVAEDVSSALVVGNLRIIRTAAAVEAFVPLSPAALRLKVLNNRLARNERCLFGHQVRSQRAQRGNVVDNPDTAPVRGQGQIAFARVDHDVSYRRGREITAFVLRP